MKVILTTLLFLFIACNKQPIDFEANVKAPEQSIQSVLKEIDATASYNSTFGFIKTYDKKYPSEIKLYQNKALKERLIQLLGISNYDLLLANTKVETPIEIIKENYAFMNGGCPHRFGIEEAALEIDFFNDELSVGLLHKEKLHFFSEKNGKHLNDTSERMQDWFQVTEEALSTKKLITSKKHLIKIGNK